MNKKIYIKNKKYTQYLCKLLLLLDYINNIKYFQKKNTFKVLIMRHKKYFQHVSLETSSYQMK